VVLRLVVPAGGYTTDWGVPLCAASQIGERREALGVRNCESPSISSKLVGIGCGCLEGQAGSHPIRPNQTKTDQNRPEIGARAVACGPQGSVWAQQPPSPGFRLRSEATARQVGAPRELRPTDVVSTSASTPKLPSSPRLWRDKSAFAGLPPSLGSYGATSRRAKGASPYPSGVPLCAALCRFANGAIGKTRRVGDRRSNARASG
jgi:hypothetical protein